MFLLLIISLVECINFFMNNRLSIKLETIYIVFTIIILTFLLFFLINFDIIFLKYLLISFVEVSNYFL
jgi:hypothetical protein